MKENRQNAILEIIGSRRVETQEELGRLLLEHGFKVTQATISRDIKELHLIKVQTEAGIYKYAVNESAAVRNTEKLLRVFRETVKTVRGTGNIVVVTTLNGSASAAAEVIDNLDIDGIVGTLAGDNTIFLAVEAEKIEEITEQLKQLSRGA